MNNHTSSRELTLLISVAALVLLTLLADIFTPLGYAVWCIYFVCVGLTLFQRRTTAPFVTALAATAFLAVGASLSLADMRMGIALVNRAIGAASVWAMAVIVWQALRARHHALRLLWLQHGQSELGAAVRGEQTPEAIAVNALRSLAASLGAQVGALYLLSGKELLLAGGIALDDRQP